MATGTVGGTGRHYATTQLPYMVKAIAFADGTAKVYTLGTLPGAAIVIRAGVAIRTAFNFGTNNLLDIGTTDDDDDFATNLACGTVGIIVADELATANNWYNAGEMNVIATSDWTGTAATTGAGFAWAEFLETNIG